MTRLYGTTYTLLAVALVLGLSSCSSSRNAQNTDDVYYSNGGQKAAASANTTNGGASQGDYYSTAPSDNYVRMAMTDPRFATFSDYNAYDSYYYSPAAASMGYGYGYPAYGFGYPAYGMGFSYGLGFGVGMGFYDPYMAWNSYFMWNSWYNPYFYNPYYGVPVMVVGHTAPTAMYSNLRPFNSLAYRNGLYAKAGTGAITNNRYYRPGMAGTTSYNNRVNNPNNANTARPVNQTYYRPGNNSNGGFRPSFSAPTRSFSSPSLGGGGGGFRPGRH
jgi:hypothetical protein